MDSHILIACTGALINMALSVTVPCLIKDSKKPFLKDIKEVFKLHRQVIVTSSIIVALTIYLALKLTPDISINLRKLTGLKLDTTYESKFNDRNLTGVKMDTRPDYEFNRNPLVIRREFPQEIPQEFPQEFPIDYMQHKNQEMPPQLFNLIKLMNK
jgi:hypothetical protein